MTLCQEAGHYQALKIHTIKMTRFLSEGSCSWLNSIVQSRVVAKVPSAKTADKNTPIVLAKAQTILSLACLRSDIYRKSISLISRYRSIVTNAAAVAHKIQNPRAKGLQNDLRAGTLVPTRQRLSHRKGIILSAEKRQGLSWVNARTVLSESSCGRLLSSSKISDIARTEQTSEAHSACRHMLPIAYA